MCHNLNAPQYAKRLLTNAGVSTGLTALAISHISEPELLFPPPPSTTQPLHSEEERAAKEPSLAMQIFGMFFSLPSVHDSYLLYYS
jgi:hypothetical protein